jgi:hypothetical protein
MCTHVQERPSWQLATVALLAAADGREDVGVATHRVEDALFLKARWLPPK